MISLISPCLILVLVAAENIEVPEVVMPYIQAPPQVYNYVHYGWKNASNVQADMYSAAAPVARVCGPQAQERVKQCADPLYRVGVFGEGASGLSWQHFLSKTKDYFTEVCDNFFVFDLCIEPYKDICFDTSNARFQYDSALKVLDFLCRDGYGEMMRNFDCFTRTLTRAEMMQCQAEMVADTRKIPYDMEGGSRNAAACGAMRNYVDCVRYPIRYECGYRAWQLVRELIVRPSEALLPGCQLNSSNGILTLTQLLIVLFVTQMM